MKTLVYTLCIGDTWEPMREIMVESLRTFGEYTGDLRVYRVPCPVEPALSRLNHIWFQKAFIGRDMELEGYDKVAYVDSDCIFTGPIQPLFDYSNHTCAFPEFEMVGGAEAFYLGRNAPPEPGVCGINAGVIVGTGGFEWNRMCHLWIEEAMTHKAWDLDCRDQNAFNLLIRSKRIQFEPLPENWVHFSKCKRAMTKDVRVIHCICPDKLAMQKGFFEMLKLWK